MLKSKILVGVLIIAVSSAVAFWAMRDPAGVTTINPARPPQPILEPDELEKLQTLQDTNDVFLMGSISPDDTSVIVAAGPSEGPGSGEPGSTQVVWLDIPSGDMEPIDPKFLELMPQSEIAWSNNQTAVYLSSNSNGDPLLVTLQRDTGEIKNEVLDVQGRPLSLAPNGSRLLIEGSSNADMELWVKDRSTGKTDKLLSYPAGNGPQSMAWSADGSKLAIVRYDIPPDADQKQIAEIAVQDALGKLPLEQNPFFSGNIVEIFDLTKGDFGPSVLRTTDAADGDGYLFKQVSWSPDGQLMLAKMMRPSQPTGRAHPVVVAGAFPDRSYYRIYDAELNLTGKLDQPEIEAPSASSAMFISSDEVIVTAAHGLSFHLFHFNLESGEFRRLPTEAGTFGEGPSGFQVFATHQSRKLIYNQSSFARPPEIYLLELEGGEPRILTQFNTEAATANQIRVDEVSFELSESVTRIGYLLQPAGATFPPQGVPIVVHQQGGPGGAMTNRWGVTSEDPFNLLPNFGISVLFMPFVGREGFGPEFYRALADDDNFGQIDVDESALAASYLLEHGYADVGEVGITGCSYGGYVVNQSVTQYLELYTAANSQCSIVDLAEWWEQNPYLVDFYQGVLPADQPDEYRQDSPLYNADAVRTPLLLFHGTDDFLPIKLVSEFRKGVADTETPIEMLVFKNEGHSLSQATSRLVAAQEQIVWFRKYLGIQNGQ